jgi:transposase InsO family protein
MRPDTIGPPDFRHRRPRIAARDIKSAGEGDIRHISPDLGYPAAGSAAFGCRRGGQCCAALPGFDPVRTVSGRECGEADRALRPAGGVPPEITGLLEQVQADHTPVDVSVVDERHRVPVGRPHLTVAIDMASRCAVGLVVTLEAPSAPPAGPCRAHTAADKPL